MHQYTRPIRFGLIFSLAFLRSPSVSFTFDISLRSPAPCTLFAVDESRGKIEVQESTISGIPRVVVVGGGVGGLAIASRIASSLPCQVTIVEKNKFVGGRCGSFSVKVPGIPSPFRHERGPSLLLLPRVYERLFEECGNGKTAIDYGLEIKPCLPAYQVIFDDGDTVDVGFPQQTHLLDHDRRQMEAAEAKSRAKMNSFEPNGAVKWDEYMRACEAYLDCGLPNFIEEKFDLLSFPAFLRESLRDFGKGWPLKPHSDVLDAFFASTKMKALASFQDLYVGLEPYRNDKKFAGGVLETTAPAVFGLLAAIELHPTNTKCGVYAPVGGFEQVTQSMSKLADELGVRVKCGLSVTKVCSDGVYCVETESSSSSQEIFEEADLVVINADLPYATKSLLEEPNTDQPTTFDWDENYKFSCGVIAFHWSVNKSLDGLNTHNVFLSARDGKEAVESWQALRGETLSSPFQTKDKPFNFYVHRASKTDPSAAPENMDSILVLVPCPSLERSQKYFKTKKETIEHYRREFGNDIIDRARQAVFDRMAVIDSLQELQSWIVDEEIDTPVTYASQYNVAAGTPFALSHGLGQLSLTRPGPVSSGVPNVMFCGASTRPGNGVPLVLVGAEQVSKKAVASLRKVKA